MKNKLLQLLEKRVNMFLSTYPYGPPIIIVQKKDINYRMYIYYQDMKKITIKNIYHLLRIDNLYNNCSRTRYFQIWTSSLDTITWGLMHNMCGKQCSKWGKVCMNSKWWLSIYVMQLKHSWFDEWYIMLVYWLVSNYISTLHTNI